MPDPRRVVPVGIALLGLGCLVPQALPAQEPPVEVQATAPVADSVPSRVSPSGAFLRSLLVPGWGQSVSDAHSRAVFYTVAQGSTALMFFKSRRALAEARERVTWTESDASRRAGLMGILDADSVAAFVDADESVVDARALEEARGQQREDWLAFGLFMLLLGGADAFVSAHLADFPEALTVEPTSGTGDVPAVEVGIRIPLGFSPPARSGASDRRR